MTYGIENTGPAWDRH